MLPVRLGPPVDGGCRYMTLGGRRDERSRLAKEASGNKSIHPQPVFSAKVSFVEFQLRVVRLDVVVTKSSAEVIHRAVRPVETDDG